jgi:hypothetical protein
VAFFESADQAKLPLTGVRCGESVPASLRRRVKPA